MGKKFLALVAACAMMFTMSATAFAASPDDASQEVQVQESSVTARAFNYFSGGTGTLNTMAGSESKHDPISSGSVPHNATVTDVEVRVTVSRGSIPFYLVVVSPTGQKASRYIGTSQTLHFDEFNDMSPDGKWFIYIYNTGSQFTDVSTANARMTVRYNY